MPHETTLITTIAGGLVLAFVFGFIASRLRIPPLVGYLLAGIAVGPHTPGYVADAALALQLAEIGVILLMFGVGLHFSVKDLLAVRRIAVPGAVVQILTATAIGAGLAHAWGWGLGAGLVFGLALSVASTVVLLRALEERKALDSSNGRIAVGWLIVEDMVMVLALVLLPAFAVPLGGTSGGGAAGGGPALLLTVALTMGKVAAFVVLMLAVGRRLIPRLLMRVARTGSRELFTLAVLALALGIALGAVKLFDVSFALGAFFAGVVLSESDLSHQAAADTLPLKDAFAVLFFVSVGMLFDPSILVRQPVAVALTVLTIVLGKSLAAFAIVLALGHPLATALTVSASLAQIGEFSFILAGLGITLGVLPEAGRDLLLAGALLSITLNPFVFKGADRLAAWLAGRPGLLRQLESRAASAPPPAAPGSEGLHDHAVIVGFGRVGRMIGEALDAHDYPFIAVERDRYLVEEARQRHVPAVFGDGSAPGILQAAAIARARLLIVTTPDSFTARRVIEIAQAAQPEIEIVVRSHSETEAAHLETCGVGLTVVAEREVALGMIGFALHRMGLSEGEAQLFVQSARWVKWDATEPEDRAPELRRHRGEAG
jgi:CPA2 family monovalent cation:H+ antiporter-2